MSKARQIDRKPEPITGSWRRRPAVSPEMTRKCFHHKHRPRTSRQKVIKHQTSSNRNLTLKIQEDVQARAAPATRAPRATEMRSVKLSVPDFFSAKMRLCQFASQPFLGFWSKLFLSAPFQVLSTWKCKGPQTTEARLGFAPSPASECMSKGTLSYLVSSQFNEAEH